MKAQNLTVSVPNRGCDKNCPYCISRMTGYIKSNFDLMKRNHKKVIKLAEAANVTNVLITGKGEPLLNRYELGDIVSWFQDFPLELQTNGRYLSNHLNTIQNLADLGLNIMAFSIDNYPEMYALKDVVKHCHYSNLVVRFTANITDALQAGTVSLEKMVQRAKDLGAHQFTVRNIIAPRKIVETDEAKETVRWIERNVNPLHYKNLMKQILANSNGNKIREINFDGEKQFIFDFDGIAVTAFESCIQERTTDTEVRSLIFQEDGHVYTAWNSEASILF